MATSDKYDRQLRLWGAEGQQFLMQANILLIHANGVGAETLKNLVLPGIKSFTILDDYCVDDSDLGCNFFTVPEAKGKPRAEVVANLLSELNPDDVTASARVANFQNVLQTEPEYFKNFTLILAANIPQTHLLPLADLCWKENIPLLVLRSYGLLGSVRLQLRRHHILDGKEERDQHDLRLTNPFPEFVEYCQEFQLESMDSMEHSHVPYPVLLFQALGKWQAANRKGLPQTFSEKEDFKTVLRGMARDLHKEMNFEQALKECYRAYVKPELSSGLADLLADEEVLAEPSAFGCMAAALKEFLASHEHCLPVAGTLPDMVSTTDSYVRLQQLFFRKAQQDLQDFRALVQQQLQERGLESGLVTDEEMERFCRRSAALAVLRTTSLREELSQPSSGLLDALQDDLYSDPAQTPAAWYLCLRAAEVFFGRFARYPGQAESAVESDTETLFAQLQALTAEFGLPASLISADESAMEVESAPVLSPAHALEIVRFGAAEIHNISSIIGGIAAQEAVKVLTHQYVPINNTYLFNGIAGCGATYDL